MKSSVYFIATCIAVERESEDGEIDLGRESRVSPTRLFRFISTRQVARKDEQKSTLVKYARTMPSVIHGIEQT
ncbi:hypothetical protein HID58_040976 [Brassica napus]|uniref:Uncharacterized protein n=1 Tax=Brassica napus TaxID=3708 RepID=A0ABQ8B9W9_BRANA|nr:hypothetical protein HID58_040976 [Brassica napus]